MKDKRVMSYCGHVIWKNDYGYMVALKKDGTDEHYETVYEAMEAIKEFEKMNRKEK